MASSSLKCLRVRDYEAIYTTKEKVISFRKSINLFGSEDEEDVIIEPCSEYERINLVPFPILKETLCISPSYMTLG